MSRFGVKEVADVTFYDLTSGAPVLYLDTLKMSDIENKATTVYARGGKGNPRIMGWDFDREATLKMQDALLTFQGMAMLAGAGALTTPATQTIYKREVLTVTGTSTFTATLSQTPVTNSVQAFLLTGDNYTQGTEALTVSLTGTTATVSGTGVSDGSKVVFYYQWTTTNSADVITINAQNFPGYYKIIGDTVIRNETTGADEAFQIVIPKAKLDPSFTLTLKPDGDPTVFDFQLEVFQDGNDNMIQLIHYTS